MKKTLTPLEINKLDEIYIYNEIGVPMTPGKWTSEEKYETVTCIRITQGGYLNQPFTEILKKVTPEQFNKCMQTDTLLETTRYDGKKNLN